MTSRNGLSHVLAAILFAATSTLAWAQTEAPATASPAVQAHADDEAPSEASERFVAVGDGTVRDSETGMLWADKDNGGDIDWPGAQRYCEAMGPGWGLPSSEELLRIFDAQQKLHQECIGELHCKITPLIAMSGLTPWTRETNGSDEAWYVYLADGQRYAYAVSNTQGKRALCVRNP